MPSNTLSNSLEFARSEESRLCTEEEIRLLRLPILMVLCLAMAAVAAPTIGTITSNGRFHLNGAEVWNQSALLDGAAIRTETSASRLLLRNGTDLRLGTATTGKVYADRVELEAGAVEGLLPTTFRLETGVLRVRIQGENSRAHVRVSDGQVLVASLQGMVRVHGAQGILLAAVQEGTAVQLSAAEQGTKAGAQLTGVIQHHNYRYFLTDETSGVTVELKGEDVAKYAGRRVTIHGEVDTAATPAGKAEYAIRVKKIEVATEAAVSPPNLATKPTMRAVTKAGIVAGVVVAGVATTGLVVAGSEEEPSTVSPRP